MIIPQGAADRYVMKQLQEDATLKEVNRLNEGTIATYKRGMWVAGILSTLTLVCNCLVMYRIW